VNLTFGPLSGILAAGNRVMIKPSEYTRNVSELMAELIHNAFDREEIAVFPAGQPWVRGLVASPSTICSLPAPRPSAGA